LGRLNDSNSYKANIIKEFDLLVRVDKIFVLPPLQKEAEESKVSPHGGSNPSSPFKPG